MAHGPIEPEVREHMNSVAKVLDEFIPKGYGFALLVFPVGEAGRMNYISNASREDMFAALKELVAHWEGQALDEPPGKM